MNYLAHLYLADISHTSLVGNFLGDFVRGRIDKIELPEAYKQGVYLHRKIDVFTDSHWIVNRSKKRVSQERRRYAGIIVDIAYDHFLAKFWRNFSSQTLENFVKKFYKNIESEMGQLPENCEQIVPHLIRGNWLENYQSIDGASFALNGIGSRFTKRYGRKNPLLNSVDEILENYQELEQDFDNFFPDLIEYTLMLKIPRALASA